MNKILLVEDDMDYARLIIDNLVAEGIKKNNIILKRNGQNATEYIQRTYPQRTNTSTSIGLSFKQKDNSRTHSQVALVILDINLSKVHEIEVLKFIKKSPAYRSIPVIIISTNYDTEILSKAFENGANGFITKSMPYDEEFVKNIKILSEFCKLVLPESSITSKDRGDKFVTKPGKFKLHELAEKV
ncbi:MAG: response regulator [Candidatus Scalindua sp.]